MTEGTHGEFVIVDPLSKHTKLGLLAATGDVNRIMFKGDVLCDNYEVTKVGRYGDEECRCMGHGTAATKANPVMKEPEFAAPNPSLSSQFTWSTVQGPATTVLKQCLSDDNPGLLGEYVDVDVNLNSEGEFLVKAKEHYSIPDDAKSFSVKNEEILRSSFTDLTRAEVIVA